ENLLRTSPWLNPRSSGRSATPRARPPRTGGRTEDPERSALTAPAPPTADRDRTPRRPVVLRAAVPGGFRVPPRRRGPRVSPGRPRAPRYAPPGAAHERTRTPAHRPRGPPLR